MSELRPDDQARLRRAFRFVDEGAPLAPDLADLGVITAKPQTTLHRSAWTAAAALAVTLAVLVPLLFLGGEQSNPVLPPIGAAPTTSEATTTTSQPRSSVDRLPLDGRAQDLGVTSIDFMTALFPTSPEEHRQTAAWTAIRHNVEQSWVEICMVEGGVSAEMPRILALDVRRNADMPDFELDAELGIIEGTFDGYEGATAPAGSSAGEATAWQDAYTQCSDVVETKRSERFDQVIGQAVGSWWDTVRRVNTSSEMAQVTDRMLSCAAAQGGPQVDAVRDLYSDSLTMNARDLETAAEEGLDLAGVIAECAGDYNQIRQSLLIPEREQIEIRYETALAEAETYFIEVLDAAGTEVAP